jgi:aerobic C4-dicarboxylate transport protein
MSTARSLTNFIGNGVASIVVARWEKELDRAQLAHELTGRPETLEINGETVKVNVNVGEDS